MYLWWSLRTLYLQGKPCIYKVNQVFVVVLELRILSAISLACWFCTSALGLVLFQIYVWISLTKQNGFVGLTCERLERVLTFCICI